jgi:hypothetical protein
MDFKIIGLVGRGGAGKSTVAGILREVYGFEIVKFAGTLKNMLRGAGLSDEMLEGRLKREPLDILCGKTPTDLMRTLGTEWGRMLVGEEFWVNMWKLKATDLQSRGKTLIVSDDCRFPNEHTAIRSLGGVFWRVRADRPGVQAATVHESERYADTMPVDWTIENHEDLPDARDHRNALVPKVMEALAHVR